MAKIAKLIALAGALALGACEEMTPAEQARWDAELACSDRASAAFPILASLQDVATADEQGSNTDDFRLGPSGQFVWTMTHKGKKRPLTDSLSCAGNMNDRTIQFVELNGVKKRPESQEVWKF